MPKTYHSQLDRVFEVLSDPTRRSILERLKKGDAVITELAGNYQMSFQAISKHLRKLEKAGLLVRKKRGRECICKFNSQPLREAVNWIARHHQFWQQNFDALDDFLDSSFSQED